jgi:hypothetical protein
VLGATHWAGTRDTTACCHRNGSRITERLKQQAKFEEMSRKDTLKLMKKQRRQKKRKKRHKTNKDENKRDDRIDP